MNTSPIKPFLLASACLSLAFSSLACASTHGHSGLPTTPEQQAALTPDAVLQQLKEGNKAFVSGQYDLPDLSGSVEAANAGQFPKAYIPPASIPGSPWSLSSIRVSVISSSVASRGMLRMKIS